MTSYLIEGPWAGQLAIVPRPRGGDWLDDEMRALKDAGFDLVVSLLTRDESQEFGLDQETSLSREHGLQFCEFPIRDLGVPDSSAAAQEFIGKLHDALTAGKRVAIHCRQGIGRSGLIGSSLLVMSGINPAKAFRLVSAARGLPVPETPEQKDWVVELSRESAEPVARR
jgi:protein-tyrosine phosphatase